MMRYSSGGDGQFVQMDKKLREELKLGEKAYTKEYSKNNSQVYSYHMIIAMISAIGLLAFFLGRYAKHVILLDLQNCQHLNHFLEIIDLLFIDNARRDGVSSIKAEKAVYTKRYAEGMSSADISRVGTKLLRSCAPGLEFVFIS